MNDTIQIFQNIHALSTSKSIYDKSIEIDGAITYPDETIFKQINEQLSKCTTKDDELLTCETDYLSPLLLFLLEHVPLEIDLDLLTSTETEFYELPSTNKRIYKPNLFPSNQNIPQYSSESQMILKHLYEFFQINSIAEFLNLKRNSEPIFFDCLHLLQPFLSKTTYDKHPMAIKLFVHIVKSMSHSLTSEIIDYVFPVCLITLDDPSIDTKLIGLYLLEHLQRYCTTTDLLLYNRADVVM